MLPSPSTPTLTPTPLLWTWHSGPVLPAPSAPYSPLPANSIFHTTTWQGELIFQALLWTCPEHCLPPPSSFFILCPDHSDDKALELSTALVCLSVCLCLQALIPPEQGTGFVCLCIPIISHWDETNRKGNKSKPSFEIVKAALLIPKRKAVML